MRRAFPFAFLLLWTLCISTGPMAAQEPGHQGDRAPHFPAAARRPLGVYTHFDIEDLTNGYTGTEEVHKYLRGMYASYLANPAVTGLTVGQHWDHIQLSDPSCVTTRTCTGGPDGYDWSYLDGAFEEANEAHKTVQVIITPGVDAPQWLLAKLSPCDNLFTSEASSVPEDCGTFQFVGIPEEDRADYTNPVFPMPWNEVYKRAWWDFLTHLNARYRDNPAFVAVELGGPTGASVEIILPTTANETQLQVGGLGADDVWSELIQHAFPDVPSYQNTDQVFVDQWKETIDAYERIFSGVTLILSPDSGDALPEFKKQNPTVAPPPFPDQALVQLDCSEAIAGTKSDLRSCEAKAEIISYFVAVPGFNAKSTEVGGMTAASAVTLGDIGIPGMKLLTLFPQPPPFPILAGAQFDHRVSNQMDGEGCPAPGPPCTVTVEEAGYNVLQVFFYGTPAAGSYGETPGPARVEYLDVPPQDIEYADATPCPMPASTTLGKTSLQDLLNRANHDLLAMAGRPTPLPPPTCP